MKIFAYSIFDQCSGLYTKPNFALHDNLIKREFTDLCSGTDNPYAAHPEHYSIHRVGLFDDTNAHFEPEQPQCIITGLEAIAASQKILPGALNGVDIPDSPGGTA